MAFSGLQMAITLSGRCRRCEIHPHGSPSITQTTFSASHSTRPWTGSGADIGFLPCLCVVNMRRALIVDSIANDGAGHAMAPATAAAQLSADDRDYFDARLAQQCVRVDIAVVGKDDTR